MSTIPPTLPQDSVPPQGAFPPPLSPPTMPQTESRYHDLWMTPFRSVGRIIGTLILGGILFFVSAMIFTLVGILIDIALGSDTLDDLMQGTITMTPGLFLGNNLALAGLIVVTFVLSRLLFKQPGGFMSSVTGKFRWGWFGWCLIPVVVIWGAMIGIETIMSFQSNGFDLQAYNYTAVLAIGILITTPLQSAGEEYFFRGLLFRGISTLFKNRKAGLIVGAVVSSALFSLAHLASDVWLVLFYFCLAMFLCWLADKTGGLEAGIAVHVVNNLLSLARVPWVDFSQDLFDRSAGSASFGILAVRIVAMALTGAAVMLLVRRRKIKATYTPEPAVRHDQFPQVPPAQAEVPPLAGEVSLQPPTRHDVPRLGGDSDQGSTQH